MDFASFRDQLAADLVSAVPAGVKVDVHPGRFDLGELERYAVEAPCMRITLLSASDTDASEPYDDVEVGAYIVTKTGKAGLPDKQLFTLATGVMAYLRYFQVGGADAGAAQHIKFSNLFSSSVGRDGVALGAVTWRQTIPLDAPASASLEDFLMFYAAWDVGESSDSPQADTEVDYTTS